MNGTEVEGLDNVWFKASQESVSGSLAERVADCTVSGCGKDTLSTTGLRLQVSKFQGVVVDEDWKR